MPGATPRPAPSGTAIRAGPGRGRVGGRVRGARPAGLGSAGDETPAVDALARAVGGADAGEPGRELVEVGLPDEDRPCIEQPPDDGGVARRPVGEGGTPRGRREPRGVDVV